MRTTILIAAILIGYKLNPEYSFGWYWLLILLAFCIALIFDLLNLNGDNVDELIKVRQFRAESKKTPVNQLLKDNH